MSPTGEDEDEVAAYLGKILDRQAFDGTGLIYGMGHAVYTLSDPRAEVCRRYARTLAAKKDLGEEFALIERIEHLAPQVMRDHGMTKPICANIDLYTGFIYKMLGVPETLFTPLFAVARMAGLVGTPHGRALLRAPYHPPRLSSGDRAAGVQAARRPLGRGPL